jgi:hypothetical protein
VVQRRKGINENGRIVPVFRESQVRLPITSRRFVVEYKLIWNPNETYKDFFEPLDDRKEALNDAAMMEDSHCSKANAEESGSVGQS